MRQKPRSRRHRSRTAAPVMRPTSRLDWPTASSPRLAVPMKSPPRNRPPFPAPSPFLAAPRARRAVSPPAFHSLFRPVRLPAPPRPAPCSGRRQRRPNALIMKGYRLLPGNPAAQKHGSSLLFSLFGVRNRDIRRSFSLFRAANREAPRTGASARPIAPVTPPPSRSLICRTAGLGWRSRDGEK
jgi:hypothetical protein